MSDDCAKQEKLEDGKVSEIPHGVKGETPTSPSVVEGPAKEVECQVRQNQLEVEDTAKHIELGGAPAGRHAKARTEGRRRGRRRGVALLENVQALTELEHASHKDADNEEVDLARSSENLSEAGEGCNLGTRETVKECDIDLNPYELLGKPAEIIERLGGGHSMSPDSVRSFNQLCSLLAHARQQTEQRH